MVLRNIGDQWLLNFWWWCGGMYVCFSYFGFLLFIEHSEPPLVGGFLLISCNPMTLRDIFDQWLLINFVLMVEVVMVVVVVVVCACVSVCMCTSLLLDFMVWNYLFLVFSWVWLTSMSWCFTLSTFCGAKFMDRFSLNLVLWWNIFYCHFWCFNVLVGIIAWVGICALL